MPTLEDVQQLIPFFPSAYNIRGQVSDGAGKKEAKYKTVRQALPAGMLQAHFEGRQAISVCPILGDGNTCQWGCIDIDQYGDDGLEERVREAVKLFKLTCYIERSKSGGVHVYVFLQQPAIIKPFRRALKKLATWIGYPHAEIRPAQDSINVEEGDLGSFIVLPGFGLGVDKAYEEISKHVVTVQYFNALTEEGQYIDGPACLFPLERRCEAVGWSNRNSFLYQMAVFYRFAYPADWQDRVREYNDKRVSPPLPSNEVESLIKNQIDKPESHYRCDVPFDSVCSRMICQSRKFGIAARENLAGAVSLEGITKLETDPPTYFVTVIDTNNHNNARRIKVSAAEMLSATRFELKITEALNIVPTLPKTKEWKAFIAAKLKDVHVIPVPFEDSDAARLNELIWQFCNSQHKSRKMEDITTGRIVITEVGVDTFMWFRTVDLKHYMERQRLSGVGSRDLQNLLLDLETAGHLSRSTVDLGEFKVPVWVYKVTSDYLYYKAQIDLETQ